MTAIAVLGSGRVGTALATALHAKGHRVVLGSRTPTEGALPRLGHREAIEQSALVINALPGAESFELLTGWAAELAGKILIDVANAVSVDEAGWAKAPLFPQSSLAEALQTALPQTEVVKTLQTVNDSVMARPTPKMINFVSGNSAEAKRATVDILADLGWADYQNIDLGDIRQAHTAEQLIIWMATKYLPAADKLPLSFAIAD